MIGEIAFIIFMCFVLWMMVIQPSDEYESGRAGKVGYVFVAVAILVLGVGLNLQDHSYTHIQTQEILSLERSSETSGSFVLGFGTITTNPVYYAYSSVGEDRYTLVKITSDRQTRVVIQESDSEVPRFETIIKQTCHSDGIFYDCFIEQERSKTVFVPKGTIKKEFNG